VAVLSKKLSFDDLPFLQLMDVRAKQSDRGRLRSSEVAAKYLDAITTVASAVDAMPGAHA
jgi:hypothetical protein